MSRQRGIGFGEVDPMGMEIQTADMAESDLAEREVELTTGEDNVIPIRGNGGDPIDIGLEDEIVVTGASDDLTPMQRLLWAAAAAGLAYAMTSGKNRLWYTAGAGVAAFALAPKVRHWMTARPGLSGPGGGRPHQFPSGGGSADE